MRCIKIGGLWVGSLIKLFLSSRSPRQSGQTAVRPRHDVAAELEDDPRRHTTLQ